MASPTSAQVQQPDLDVAFYIRIEGLGDITGAAPEVSRTLYVFSQPTDWTPSAAQRFVNGLTVPSSLTDSADLLGGVGAQQGLGFEVMEFTDTNNGNRAFWANMLGTSRWSTDTTTYPSTLLNASLNRSATTMTVLSTAAFPGAPGGVLFLGNETISYTGKTATTFTGLTRGLHPVAGANYASTHRLLTPGGLQAQPIVSTRPMDIYGRELACYIVHRFPDGRWETEANALRVFTGPIIGLDWKPEHNAWSFRCDSILGDAERQVFSRQAETRMVGLNLGDNASDRTCFIDPQIAGGAVTITANAWYESMADLIEDLNARLLASEAFFQTARFHHATGGPITFATGETLDTGHVMLLATNVALQQVRLAPGLANALGWPAASFQTPPNVLGNSLISPQPAPASCFYAHANQPTGVTLYVEDSGGTAPDDGFLTDQGGTYPTPTVGWILVGKRFLFGVQTVTPAAGGAAAQFTCSTVLPPELVQYGEAGVTGLFARWAADGSVMPSESFGPCTDDKVRQVFIPQGTESSGAPVDVLTQMLQVLVSTGTNATSGAAQYNGTSDIHAVGCGLGIKAANVDTVGWLALADEMRMFGLARQRLFLEPTAFSAWAKEEGQTMGFCLVMVNGQLTVRRTPGLEISAAAAFTLTQSDLASPGERPSSSETAATVFNAVTFAYAWRAYDSHVSGWPALQDGYAEASLVLNDVESQERFGIVRKLEVKNPGYFGTADAEILGVLAKRVSIFREPIPICKMRLSRRWWGRVAPLDVFVFTNPSLPDRGTGLIGVTNKIGVVRSVAPNFQQGTVDVEFIVTPMQRQAPLAPSALLDYTRGDGGYSAGPPTRLYLRDHEFSASTAARDVTYFSVGDTILICEDGATTPGAMVLNTNYYRRTVTVVDNTTPGATFLTFSGGALGGFTSTLRWFVTTDLYSASTANERTRASYVAGTNARISGTQDFYPYT